MIENTSIMRLAKIVLFANANSTIFATAVAQQEVDMNKYYFDCKITNLTGKTFNRRLRLNTTLRDLRRSLTEDKKAKLIFAGIDFSKEEYLDLPFFATFIHH